MRWRKDGSFFDEMEELDSLELFHEDIFLVLIEMSDLNSALPDDTTFLTFCLLNNIATSGYYREAPLAPIAYQEKNYY